MANYISVRLNNRWYKRINHLARENGESKVATFSGLLAAGLAYLYKKSPTALDAEIDAKEAANE